MIKKETDHPVGDDGFIAGLHLSEEPLGEESWIKLQPKIRPMLAAAMAKFKSVKKTRLAAEQPFCRNQCGTN